MDGRDLRTVLGPVSVDASPRSPGMKTEMVTPDADVPPFDSCAPTMFSGHNRLQR